MIPGSRDSSESPFGSPYMTRFGKILVVLITFASLAFAGFAIAVTYGGPNWPQMASQIEGYKFTYVGGEKPTWTAVRARGDEQVASDLNLGKVIDAVLADKIKRLTDEKNGYVEKTPPLIEALEKSKASNAADEPALKAYIIKERARVEAMYTALQALEAQVLKKTDDAQKLENIASARREDVFRIQGELAEVRADKSRLEVIRRNLSEELEQINGNIERAEQRRESLHSEQILN